MHRVGQVTAPQFAIVADDVAAIQRVCCCESGRLETVCARNGVRSAKYLRQHFVRRGHLGCVHSRDSVRGYGFQSYKSQSVRVLRCVDYFIAEVNTII